MTEQQAAIETENVSTFPSENKRKLDDFEPQRPQPEDINGNPNLESADEKEAKKLRLKVAGSSGVCLMRNTWKNEQHPSFINFISSYLRANSFRLNFVSIAPDFIFNCGGVSVAFVFVANCDDNFSLIFERVQKLKGQFAHLYVVVTVPTEEKNEFFVSCLLKSKLELGKPPFVAVEDLEMGFEKIVKIALACGACKQQDVLSKLTVEREQAVQAMDAFVRVVSSIPGITNHEAHSLNQVVGSIEAIAKASKEYIVENTDISVEKADMIIRFFRDPEIYMSPKIQ